MEFEPQTRIEGEIRQLPADFPVTEFWRLPAGAHPGRRSAEEVTVIDSVGFALEDHAALRFARDAARELGIGEVMELVPRAEDPKDLFGVLGPVGWARAATPALGCAARSPAYEFS